MGDIRDQCKLMDPSKLKDDTTELYKEIIRLHGTIDEMNTHILRLHNNEPLEVKQWSYLNIDTQSKVPEVTMVTDSIDEQVHDQIQDLVCNGGQYLY